MGKSKDRKKKPAKAPATPQFIELYEPIPPERVREYNLQRWKRDKVEALPQGFTIVPNGRAGTIYVREGDRVHSFYAELAGAAAIDIIVDVPSKPEWLNRATMLTGEVCSA
jgi:hypothetical protein